MAEPDRRTEKEIKEEFRDKGGAAVGRDDSVVDGELDDMAGSSKRNYGQEDSPRERLDEEEKRPPTG